MFEPGGDQFKPIIGARLIQQEAEELKKKGEEVPEAPTKPIVQGSEQPAGENSASEETKTTK